MAENEEREATTAGSKREAQPKVSIDDNDSSPKRMKTIQSDTVLEGNSAPLKTPNIQFNKLRQGELSITPNFIDTPLVRRLRKDARALYKSGAFTTGVLGGRSDNKYLEKNIRVCDCCGFFDDAADAVGVGDEAARDQVMDIISQLREDLINDSSTNYNLAGFMELQYLRYPGDGGFYGKHLDQQGKNKGANSNRILSMLIYLNDDSWDAKIHGGCFRAYPRSKPMVEVEPTGGTLVLFNSKSMLHEAMPTMKERWALVGWFMQEEDNSNKQLTSSCSRSDGGGSKGSKKTKNQDRKHKRKKNR